MKICKVERFLGTSHLISIFYSVSIDFKLELPIIKFICWRGAVQTFVSSNMDIYILPPFQSVCLLHFSNALYIFFLMYWNEGDFMDRRPFAAGKKRLRHISRPSTAASWAALPPPDVASPPTVHAGSGAAAKDSAALLPFAESLSGEISSNNWHHWNLCTNSFEFMVRPKT